MAAILYYWKDYQKNLDEGFVLVGAPPRRLYQRAPRFRALQPGDRVWLVTRSPTPTRYVLLGCLVVARTGIETSTARKERYGPYFIEPDLSRSRMIPGAELLDVETAIRTQLSVKSDAVNLGHAFQGFAAVRPLTDEDEAILSALMPRGSATPPSEEEGSLDPSGVAPEVREYLREERVRDGAFPRELRRLYEGRCQVCSTHHLEGSSTDIAEAHHLTWLSEGGPDALGNMILLCPNHHRAVHAARAALQFKDGKPFLIGITTVFAVKLNKHLTPTKGSTA